MNASYVDLVNFLRARLDEDQTELRRMTTGGLVQGYLRVHGDKMLSDIDAKRRIIAECRPGGLGGDALDLVDALGALVLCLLALPYADHPDYDPEWRTS